MTTFTIEDDAKQYAFMGWPVFRIRPNSKTPYDKWVNGPTTATTDSTEIAHRWRGPHYATGYDYNIGIATGHPLVKQQGFLTVLDLDIDEPDFAGRPGWADHTYEVRTPSGGLHLYYVTEQPVPSGRIAPGIDVKSRGGMVVAPPSSIDGRFYKVERTSEHLTQVPAGTFCPTSVLSSDAQRCSASSVLSFSPAEQIGEGGRDTYLARYAGWWLSNAAEDYYAALVEGKPAAEPTEYDVGVELDYHNLMVCSPPLPERDVQRIARSIYAKHLRNGDGL